MNRKTRDRYLTAEEAAALQETRAKVAEELPELIAGHESRTASRRQNLSEAKSRALREIVAQLRVNGKAYTTNYGADQYAFIAGNTLESLLRDGLVQHDPADPANPRLWLPTPAGEQWVDERFEKHEWEDETSRFDPHGRSAGPDGVYFCTYRAWVPKGLEPDAIDACVEQHDGTAGFYWPDRDVANTAWPEKADQ